MVYAFFGKKLTHGEKGEPYVDGAYISITDTAHFWACALSDAPLGIDMEETSRTVSPSVVRKLHEAEKKYLEPLSEGSSEWKEEFLSIWTRKESYSKLKGKGLSLGFSGFCVLDGWQDSLGTALYTKIYKGLVLSATEEFDIKERVFDAPMKKTALEAGADLLDISGCSAETMRRKLLGKGYSEDEVSKAVDILLKRGYLNDAQYAEDLACKYEAKGYSSRRIELELRRKGVDPKEAREEAARHREGDRNRAQEVAARMAAGKDPGEELKAKIARKLSSLGYDTHIVYDIIQKLN